MLILTRRANERIFIGDGIAVVVLGIENNRVKLGIEAPANVSILREEIVDDGVKHQIEANLRSNAQTDSVAPAKTGTG